jgi:uncharacterized protein (TIGR03437 family)
LALTGNTAAIDGVPVSSGAYAYTLAVADSSNPNTQTATEIFSGTLSNSVSSQGSLLVDTIAGGKIRSGVLANDLSLASVTGLAIDPSGNIVFAESNIIRRIRADGAVETIAGTGVTGFSGDGGPAINAQLQYASALHFDSAGSLYFADTSWRVRRVDATGTITTVAGTGIFYSGSQLLGLDGPATAAQIELGDLAVDGSGTLFLADPYLVRRLTSAGTLEIVAGLNDQCNCSDGDGGPASAAHINGPSAIAFDTVGNLYIAEIGNGNHIRRISPDGVINQFAGYNGTSSPPNSGDGGPALTATFPAFITGLTADSAGNIYVATGGRIRRIGTDGIITTVAGGGRGGDGPANQALLRLVSCIAADQARNIYFCDNMGPSTIPYTGVNLVRELTPQAIVQTIAGGNPKAAADGTAALDSWLASPGIVGVDRKGALNIAEEEICTIRRISSGGLLTTVAGSGRCGSTAPAGSAKSADLPPIASIAFDSQNRLYLSNQFGVFVVSADGSIVPVTVQSPGSYPKLAIDSKDRIYLSGVGNTLFRINPGGILENLASWTAGLFISPGAIAVDALDNIYVIDQGRQSHSVYRLDQNGKATSIVSLFATANTLAVDGSANLWFTDAPGVIAKNIGSTVEILSGFSGFSGDGGAVVAAQFNNPSSLAFAPNGDLYVADQGNGRIRRIHGSPPSIAPAMSQGGIVNAASLVGGAIAPGELISIFGSDLGPAVPQTFAVQSNFVPKVLGNVRVYFGSYSAPVNAIASTQINVYVPYGIAGQKSVDIVVDIDGVRSVPVTVPVTNSAFGIYSNDASGSGQGAIYNQDGSRNSSSNPAARGSLITFFGTGEGLITPELPDGALVISTPYSKAMGDVTVTIGGQPADITYDGETPLSVAGTFQINARIPSVISPGDVPIFVTIGGIPTTKVITAFVN